MSPEAYLHIIDYLGQAAKLVPRARLDVKAAITRLCEEKEKEQFRKHSEMSHYFFFVKADNQWTFWTDRSHSILLTEQLKINGHD